LRNSGINLLPFFCWSFCCMLYIINLVKISRVYGCTMNNHVVRRYFALYYHVCML
jgi:hypothetical protein